MGTCKYEVGLLLTLELPALIVVCVRVRVCVDILETFTRLRKVNMRFFMSVRPSGWNKSAPNGQIFIKFDISRFFENF